MTPTPLDAYKEWLKQGYPAHNTILPRKVLIKLQEMHQQLKNLARYSADLEIDLDEEARLRKRLSELLEQTANALKGEPGPLILHDWADLPEVAKHFRTIAKFGLELVAWHDRFRDELPTIGTHRACTYIVRDLKNALAKATVAEDDSIPELLPSDEGELLEME